MKIQPVKGTRDFYPQEMAVHNFILDGWKAASVRSGFEEYEGPIFEYLKMFQIKSGDEIVEQLFNFTDRGSRKLAIRPEITPTLARMVNQKINALPRPIKWFSVPRICRAERPQKGRLREFFQWNIDIIGVEDCRADAEVIYTTIDYLRRMGLTGQDIQARISSRKLLAALLTNIGISEDKVELLYPVLDKKNKLSPDTFEAMVHKHTPDKSATDTILRLMDVTSVGQITEIADLDNNTNAALDELHKLFDLLEKMGISEYCTFDMSIVRGLAYYTGVVFEVHDIAGQLRAVCGGGRFDNLLSDFGGPKIPATGMGMGDAVLEILLRNKGLLKEELFSRKLDFFVVCVGKEFNDSAVQTTAALRKAGFAAEFSYKSGNLAKQLKKASAANAAKAVIIGSELAENNQLSIKDMATGEQGTVDADEFLADPHL